MGAALRAVPIVLLASIVCGLAVSRLVQPGPRRAPRETESAPVPARADGAAPGGLGAPLAPAPGRVAARYGSMLHGDRRHTGRARGRVPGQPRVAWKLETDGAIEAQAGASPDERSIYVGTLGGSLWAVTAAGEKLWKVDLGGRVYGSPAVGEDGTIYVGSDAGSFFAITSSGQVKWKVATDADADTSAALVQDGVVFAAGRNVFSVRSSGDVAWRFSAKGKVFTGPAVTDDGLVVFGSQDHHVYALSAAGRLVWSQDLGEDVDGAPAVGDDGAIFVGTDKDEVVRLGPAGDIVFRLNVGGFVRGTLSVARNGDVLAGVYGPAPREVRVTPAGALAGAFAVQGNGARLFGVHGGAIEDDDGTLVFGAQDDRLYAVNRSGAVAWSFATRGDVDAPALLLSTGLLVAGSDDGTLYALAGP